jgi:peroxiredoxin
MEGLYVTYKNKGFEILAVNMAEKPVTISAFLNNKVRVNFNVLMDADGAALQRWKVFAFPTSYVIDRQGRIRYAVYGAIDWQSEDVIEKLEQLLRE